jgi:uncharacterized membrane protein YidH (DUF202 family)
VAVTPGPTPGAVPGAIPGQGRDPGLQAERTSLAWSRTLIALVAVAALCVRASAHLHSEVLLSAALYAAAAVLVGLHQTVRYRRAVAGLRSDSLSPPVFDVIVLAGTTVALALQTLWWVAAGPG